MGRKHDCRIRLFKLRLLELTPVFEFLLRMTRNHMNHWNTASCCHCCCVQGQSRFDLGLPLQSQDEKFRAIK